MTLMVAERSAIDDVLPAQSGESAAPGARA